MEWVDDFLRMLFCLESKEANVEGAYMLKYGNLPKSVFKYRQVSDTSLQNLVDDTVWLADPQSFNDPYDCGQGLDMHAMSADYLANPPDELLSMMSTETRDAVTRLVKEGKNPMEAWLDDLTEKMSPEDSIQLRDFFHSITQRMYFELEAQHAQNFKRSVKACSFSTRVDSVLMWSHYANCHQGFCIEYDLSAVPYSNWVSRFMYPVIYSDRPFDATSYFTKAPQGGANILRLNLAALIKSEDWAYEKEWRILISNGFMEKAGPIAMPTPTTVYLGSHISQEDQRQIEEICRRKKIPTKKMRHANNAFEMQAVEVQDADRRMLSSLRS